jgi:hypothetical protein
MSILHNIAFKLSKFPKLKRNLKDLYQNIGNIYSDKKTYPNTIKCVSSTNSEHLFGYYDKSPWNADGTKMIYLRVKDANKHVASDSPADIVLKDLKTDTEEVIARTNSWNVQQGCMMQWLGPGYSERIIYNDFREGQYCAIILTISTGQEKILPMPIYSVSSDGTTALTLDFSRLNSFRPGYGYINKADNSINEKCPNTPCIWKISLNDGVVQPLFTYRSLLDLKPRANMKRAYHKVNHIMINPSGNRFMFLHRWLFDGVKYDRLLTADTNGNELYILLDDDMVSHCNWKDDNTIITWANTNKHGTHYYELKDKTKELSIFAKGKLNLDGHPSFSPDGRYLITDTYPDFKRKQGLLLYDIATHEIVKVAEIYANIKYKNEIRCDLHPRWKRDSSEICFDGAQGKYRQVYTLNIRDILN